jgi:Ca2+-binding RTX toxin-like protein
MAGGAGSDAYYVDDKKDVVSELAAEGNDTVFAATSYTLSANVENITLTGTGGNDAAGNALDNILTGNSGKNVLSGGAGNDVIEGGGGIDQLTGGSGNDYFVFSSVSDSLVGKKHDVITDFQQGDILDLSDIDAIIGTSTDDAFSYIGASAFSHEAGQLQFDAATGNLSGDVNGDGKADFEIHLNSVSSFAFDSFQL